MSEPTVPYDQLIQEPEPAPWRLVATLGIAGLLSGLILALAFLYTLPIIQANKARALRQAIFEVLPGCKTFQTFTLEAGKLAPAAEEVPAGRKAPPRIFAGFDENKQFIGFAVSAEEPGFQDIISGIFGYDPRRQVIIGFVVLESKETPGLGDKIIKDASFLANFQSLAVDPQIVAVKKGARQQPNEVEAITGATISSKAVVRLLERGMFDWRSAMEDYLKTNYPPEQ